jgi:hypothetical protein
VIFGLFAGAAGVSVVLVLLIRPRAGQSSERKSCAQ